MYVIGLDPGPLPGIAWLRFDQGQALRCDLLQVTPDALLPVLRSLTRQPLRGVAAIAVERFVVRHRAGRSSTPKAGDATRDMVGLVTGWAGRHGVALHQRTAADVKPWATDERLAAAGLPDVPGMRHARDAARHALFCAVADYALPDPLSRKAVHV